MSGLSQHHPATGRPLSGNKQEAIGTLTDDELETELTVTAHDPVRRARRFDQL